MLTILKLFGRSPFAPLQSHMEKIADCIHLLTKLFDAVLAEDQKEVEVIAEQISKLEHKADLAKNDIRNHLPKSLYLPIDRSHLLEILTLQDNLADKAEDVAVLVTLKPLKILDSFKDLFFEFLAKNIETFDEVHKVIKEMHDLLESSFGGSEAEKVRILVDQVAYKEHEVDLIQRRLLKEVFKIEDEMSYSTFHLWQRIFESIADISNTSEKLGWRVRRILELK
jgi:predicted phosphate transport protein (TIGR00153 family)